MSAMIPHPSHPLESLWDLEPKNAALQGMPNLVILCIQFPVA